LTTALPPAGGGKRVLPAAALVLLAIGFALLGQWQVERLAWKEALVARVESATRAAPISVEHLPSGALKSMEYRRVRTSGHYFPQGAALVTGTSRLGSGYWVLVPLRSADGPTLYVNRGFVPVGSKINAIRADIPDRPVSVTGLLRLTEAGGTWLRANRPNEGRWYSRDIAALSRDQGLPADTRYFIDAQAETPAAPRAPVPGLTVLNFPNNHLAYALTWFALAALSAGGAIVIWRKLR
jgi:surfeit locus 1 family protein